MEFRSKFESGLFDQMRVNRAVDIEYEVDKLEYTTTSVYIPDFTITLEGDFIRPTTVFYIEAKGYFSPEDRKKMLAVKKSHPTKDIRFVFQANNKIHPKSVTRYSDWAEKHGFKYAIGEAPKEWFE
jgi:Autographiviridae endonuclease I